ncbi:hypothetical protein VNO78_20197 [Psophocarpus tetragonolobus]|uniref:Uncharacterized protein n=1 Tax=Psophocarpus tetragonolobus TaxID=3891 RepID=A0AAN9XGZ6_PSOTE
MRSGAVEPTVRENANGQGLVIPPETANPSGANPQSIISNNKKGNFGPRQQLISKQAEDSHIGSQFYVLNHRCSNHNHKGAIKEGRPWFVGKLTNSMPIQASHESERQMGNRRKKRETKSGGAIPVKALKRRWDEAFKCLSAHEELHMTVREGKRCVIVGGSSSIPLIIRRLLSTKKLQSLALEIWRQRRPASGRRSITVWRK